MQSKIANIVLWVFQGLLALHTAVGAIWKWSHSERSMSTLAAIPHGVWLGLSAIEIVCVVALIVPAFGKRYAIAAPVAAAVIGVEMLFFSGVHIATGSSSMGPVVYWLVVAAVCASIVYGRLARNAIRESTFA